MLATTRATFCGSLIFFNLWRSKDGKRANGDGITGKTGQKSATCACSFNSAVRKGYTHPCLLGGPKEGGNATSPLHSRGSPNKRGQNWWRPHSCLLGGPKEGGSATSPLHSRGSPNKGGQNQKWPPQPCLLGGQKRAEVQRHPCILGGPQRQARGRNQKWPTGGHIA